MYHLWPPSIIIIKCDKRAVYILSSLTEHVLLLFMTWLLWRKFPTLFIQMRVYHRAFLLLIINNKRMRAKKNIHLLCMFLFFYLIFEISRWKNLKTLIAWFINGRLNLTTITTFYIFAYTQTRKNWYRDLFLKNMTDDDSIEKFPFQLMGSLTDFSSKFLFKSHLIFAFSLCKKKILDSSNFLVQRWNGPLLLLLVFILHSIAHIFLL